MYTSPQGYIQMYTGVHRNESQENWKISRIRLLLRLNQSHMSSIITGCWKILRIRPSDILNVRKILAVYPIYTLNIFLIVVLG